MAEVPLKVDLLSLTPKAGELIEDVACDSYQTQRFSERVAPKLIKFKSGRTVPFDQFNLEEDPEIGLPIPGYSKDDECVVRVIPPSYEKVVKFLLAIGHWRPFQMVHATFRLRITRKAALHLGRYEFCSDNFQSQKYLNQGDFEYILPPKDQSTATQRQKIRNAMVVIQTLYEDLRQTGLDTEWSRGVYPNIAAQTITFHTNFRQYRHLFHCLCDDPYVGEVQEIFMKILLILKKEAPCFFHDFEVTPDGKSAKLRGAKYRRNCKVNWAMPSAGHEEFGIEEKEEPKGKEVDIP